MFNNIYVKIKKYIKDNYKFLIGIIIIIFMCYYELPYVIYKRGGTIDLKDRVVIDNKYTQKGSLKMSYVSAMKGTPAFIFLSYIIPDWDLYPLETITNQGNYDDVIKVGKEYLSEGIDNAIIAAYRETDYNIEIIKEINKVIYISEKANTNIEIGDEIISIDNKEYKTLDEIKAYINTLKENDKVIIKVKNNNKEYEREAIIYREEDNSLKMGIAFHKNYEYKLEIPVEIKMKNNESGSSGGLMMGLSIYNALTKKDITNGLNIVGTGSIKEDGKVEEIGGVKYKVLAAEKDGADIFLCPKENYKEAINIKKKRNLKVKIIKVESLHDAIEYLNSL